MGLQCILRVGTFFVFINNMDEGKRSLSRFQGSYATAWTVKTK
jgi:hypothetical protein